MRPSLSSLVLPLAGAALMTTLACTPSESGADKRDAKSDADAKPNADAKSGADVKAGADTETGKGEETDTGTGEETDTGEKTGAEPTSAEVGDWSRRVAPGSAWTSPVPGSVLAEAKAKAEAKGAAVALTSTPKGLRLEATRGGWSRDLGTKPVLTSLYDSRSGLVLFTVDGALMALDLAEAPEQGKPPEAVTLAKLEDARDPGLWIAYPDSHAVVDPDPGLPYLRLEWSDTPKLALVPASYPPEDEQKPTPLELEAAGRKWLEARQARRSWTPIEPANAAIEFAYVDFDAPKPAAGKVDPRLADRCVDFVCGDALALGTTGFELVVVRDDSGDFMHLMTVLRDPTKNRWASLEGLAESGALTWVADADLDLDSLESEVEPLVDTGGAAFAPHRGAEVVCDKDGCSALSGTIVDFLSGGVRVGAVYTGQP